MTHIDTGTEQLLCEIVDRVAVITLNRPEARNALSDPLTIALRRQIAERGRDANVGALMITGAGGNLRIGIEKTLDADASGFAAGSFSPSARCRFHQMAHRP